MHPNQIKKAFSDIGLGLFLATMMTQVIGFLGGLGLALLYISPGRELSYSVMVLISYGCMLPGYPLLRYFFRKTPWWENPPRSGNKLSFGQIMAVVVACIGAAYPFAYLASLLSVLLSGFGLEMENPIAEMTTGAEMWVVLVLVVILAPIIEEYVFRHLLYKKLICFGGKVYILVSAFLFGLYHMNVYQMQYAFILGIILAAVMCYTGDVRYTMLIHAIYNAVSSASLVLEGFGEIVLGGWGLIMIGLLIAGILLLIWWIVNNRRQIGFGPPPVAIPDMRLMFKNVGMILFFVMVAVFVLFTNVISPLLTTLI